MGRRESFQSACFTLRETKEDPASFLMGQGHWRVLQRSLPYVRTGALSESAWQAPPCWIPDISP